MKKADILRALALLSLVAAAVAGLIVLSVNAPLREALPVATSGKRAFAPSLPPFPPPLFLPPTY